MILKKPYAFFIKMFKPIHLMLFLVVLYLISLSNNILKFLNEYIYSFENIATEELIKSLINVAFYIIPVVIIIIFIFILGIMYKKNKPVIFYFVGIFSFIVILIINVYAVNFLNVLVENVVSIRIVKLVHDFVLISIILESICLITLFIRGLGIDFKKFNFNSDISNFKINESDNEEFELNIKIDFEERKRKRKERLRNFKYLYLENKLIINIFIIISLVLIILEIIYFVGKHNKVKTENIYYETSLFNFKINSTVLLNTDFRGNKITENYLLIVDTSIKPKYTDQKLFLNDFSLRIENYLFKPVKKYSNKLIDLGDLYQEEILDMEYSDYLFVFEIPEKYISEDMLFRYKSEGNLISVSINPKKINYKEKIIETKKMQETLNFKQPLNNVKLKINNYELKKYFLIEYKYCLKKNDCILSKEYLKPSIDENYDKVILKLDIEYKTNEKLEKYDFYYLLSNFGMVYYKVDGKWINTFKFEKIISKKNVQNDNIFIGINSNILKADSIKLVFDIRGQKYEYVLK